MNTKREPDKFDQALWARRFADDDAWKAMIEAAQLVTAEEYDAVEGLELSLIPFQKLAHLKNMPPPFVAIHIFNGAFLRCDTRIYEREFKEKIEAWKHS